MVTFVLTSVCLLAPSLTVAAPVLQSADIRIAIQSSASCEVSMELSVGDAREVEHRLALFEGETVELLGIQSAEQLGDSHVVGRTKSLTLRPGPPAGRYSFRYRVALSRSHEYRCPLWLPVAPADGRFRNVRLRVQLPSDALATGGTFPTFTWQGQEGTATLGHIPAFVRVPYAPGVATGARSAWHLARAMDAIAVAAFTAVTGLWLWRRRR